MRDIEPSAVEGAVGGDAAEQLGDGAQAALARALGALHYQRGSAHAHQHAVPAAIERQRGLLHDVVGSGGAAREKTGADPLQQVIAGHVVAGDHDHAAAAASADPVLGQRQRLGGAGARRVELGVGASSADQLGELRVAHGQHAEQEAPVELERLTLHLRYQLVALVAELGA